MKPGHTTVVLRSAMRERHHSSGSPVDPSTYTARLARYLGPDLAVRLTGAAPGSPEDSQASTQLEAVCDAIATYLPQHLVARQLHATTTGPWLHWVDGTLLFADVSGSTALAERLTALGREGTEIVTATLNSYFGTMIRRIQAAGGDLLTFGGDALLVLFDGPDHARTATAAALALLADTAGFERSVPGVGTFPLTMHIGVETGPVALVSAGQPHALRYSAMGATVNAVARAEAFGGKGELVLGPRAWAAVAASAEGEPLPATGGFVRVRALREAPPPRSALVSPRWPREPATTAEQALQLDRLSPYLPLDLLARIVADPRLPRVEADLRPVTVLFAQVRGLSPLVEHLPPERAAVVVDAFLRPMQDAVEQFGGFINKLDLADEGDKLMAVFGAPSALEDHPERAARAALAMQQAVAECSLRIAARANLPAATCDLHVRIGLNTGNVFAGNVGTPERKEYTVMGDAVNVAARVMAQSGWGEVRCSAATAALISHALEYDDLRRVAVRGKSEPLELVRLVGERERGAPPASNAAPLVGRTHELQWLREHLAAAASGTGRVVRVAGEAGIGKSRLATALVEEALSAGARLLSTRCMEFNSATPYTPWGDLLRELCGISSGDDQAARSQKLAGALTRAGVDPADWLPLMAELVRLEADDTPVLRALDPQQRQTRRFEIVLALLQAHATPSPLIVLLDHLQWADQVSLDLWQYVADRIAGDPILLLGLHRGALTWGSGPQGDGAATLELGPLSRESSEALLDTLAGPEGMDASLRASLAARAGGNPLFLEELQRAVTSTPGDLEALPDSLSGLLLARIDRLDESSRTLLRVASVIGQRFPVGIVQSVHERDYESLIRSLVYLDTQELTSTERERPERVHLFRHALLQEVAYQSLLYARRRELHRRIGEYLEHRYAAELASVRTEYTTGQGLPLVQIGRNGSLLSRDTRANGAPIFLLAHHFRLSDVPARAVPYLLLAGHIARDDYANDQAIQHFRWALEALSATPADPRVWEAREALGDVLCTLGRYDEALDEYARVLDSGTTTLPPAVAAEVLRSMGDALEKRGHYAEALARLRGAEQLCLAHLGAVPPLLLAAIYADMGQVLRRTGDFDAALEICKAGLVMLRDDRRSAEDERIEAELQMLMGTLYAMRGDYEIARFHFENGLAAQESVDDLYGCARSHNNLGYLAQLQSDYVRAVRHYAEAETLARKVQTKYMLSSVLLNAAYAYYRLDRYHEAEEACRDALELCTAMGERDGIAKVYDTLGIIAYNRGEYPEAQEHYRTALALHRELGGSYEEANTLALLAVAHTACGDIGAARAAASQALEVARRIQVPQLEVEALNALAEAELAAATALPTSDALRLQLLERAAALAAEASEAATRLGSRLDAGVALRLQGEAAALLGQPFAAYFAQARERFTSTNSAFELARVDARQGEALAACNDPSASAYLRRATETLQQIGAGGELRRLAAHDERSA